MNQILYVEKNKGKGIKKNKRYFDLNKIVLFLAISLIVFGVATIGEGTYAVIRNSNYSKQVENAGPNVSIQQNGQNVVIEVTHKKAIDSITYSWNGGENIVINGNNRTYILAEIELPRGNNILNVAVKDISGKQFVDTKSFSIDTGNDIQKPNINLSVAGNYIKMSVTDDTEISYVTYRWNDETEEVLHPSGVDLAKLEETIEIRKGQNTLTVIAVDNSNNTRKRSTRICRFNKTNSRIIC